MDFAQNLFALPKAEKLRLASDPGTTPELLSALVAGTPVGARDIRDALASNPSTPIPDLIKLLETTSEAFCRNPVAPLVALEEPDFARRVSPLSLGRLLRCQDAPLPLVLQLAEGIAGDYLAGAAQRHLQLRHPLEDNAWREEVHRQIREWLDQSVRDRFHQEVYELVDLGALPESLANGIPGDRSLPECETREQLRCRLDSREVRALDRGYSERPQDLTGRESVYLLVGASFRRDIPQEELEFWCRRYPRVAEAVVRNPEAEPEILLTLLKEATVSVRRMALKHPNSPENLAEIARQVVFSRYLAGISESVGRAGVWTLGRFAAAFSAPAIIRVPCLHPLASSVCWEERLIAALSLEYRRPKQRRKTQQHLLEELARDGDYLVQAVARAHLRGEVFDLFD